MINKIICFFGNKNVLFVIALLIICCIGLITYNNFFYLDEHEYTSIECCIGYNFNTNNSEEIGRIINFLNDSRLYRTFKRVDTLASPEFVLNLKKKDGTQESVEIYSGAWNEGLYLLYNDTQYKITDCDEFLERIEVFLGN